MSDRTIVAVEWPVNPWPKGYVIAALICIGLALFSVIVVLDPMYRANVDPIYSVIGGLVAIGVAAEMLRRLLRDHKRWRRQMRRLHEPSEGVDPLTLSIERYLHGRRAYSVVSAFARLRVDWSTFRAHLASDAFTPPRTVVDTRIGERFQSEHDLPEYLVETEEVPILGVGQAYMVLLLVGAVIIVGTSSIAWWPQLSGIIQNGRFYVVVAAVLVLTAPFRRFLVSAGRGLGCPLAVLASPGVIDNQRGKRWVAGEATMFVCTFGDDLHVAVVGPSGRLALYFDGSSSREFKALWQRWNHPHPRPELSL